MNADVIVIGAGTVGAAIGYGLAGRGERVLVLDGGDRDVRAANANFGLVWLHGKGMDMPAYYFLTRNSVDAWQGFAEELAETTAIDLQYEHDGGLVLCLGEADFEERRSSLLRLHNQLEDSSDPDWEMLDDGAVRALLPGIELGREVSGASLGRRDGHANPLRLLASLQAGIVRKGGSLRGGSTVHSVEAQAGGGFTVGFGSEKLSAARVVIAAGIGSTALARQVGLDVPIRPQRGQILVTEKVMPVLPLPTLDVRQTREGSIMIGATHEEVGLDCSTTSEAAAVLSASALRQFPGLRDVSLVRQWAGLRILTPDGFPIYAESETHPGAFVALCHSGVTLAAFHAGILADCIAGGQLSEELHVFHHRRFDVPKAA